MAEKVELPKLASRDLFLDPRPHASVAEDDPLDVRLVPQQLRSVEDRWEILRHAHVAGVDDAKAPRQLIRLRVIGPRLDLAVVAFGRIR